MGFPQIGLEAIFGTDGFQKGIKTYLDGVSNAEGKTDQAAASITKGLSAIGGSIVTGALAAGAAAIAAVTSAAIGGVAAVQGWAETLDGVGDVLGTSSQESAALAVAIQGVGGNVDQLTGQMAFMTRGLFDSEGKIGNIGQVLQKLGVSFQDANGNMLPTTQILEQVANKVGTMPDGLEKTRLMMSIFGKSGKDLSDVLGALANGGLAAADEKARQLGLSLSGETTDAAIQLGREFQTLKMVGQGLMVTLGAELLPVLQPLIQQFVKWAVDAMPQVRELMGQIAQKVGAFVQVVVENMPAVVTWFSNAFGWLIDHKEIIVGALAAIGTAIGVWLVTVAIPALIATGTAFLAAFGPALLIMGAIGVAAALLYKAWDTNFLGIRDAVTNAWTSIQPTLQEWGKKFSETFQAVKTKATEVFGNLKPVVQKGMDGIRAAVQPVLAKLQAWWKEHGDSVMTVVKGLFDLLKTIFAVSLGVIKTVIEVQLKFWAKFWQDHGDTITKIVTVLWDGIKKIISLALDLVGDIFDAFAALFRGDWDAFGKALQRIWEDVWDLIKAHFDTIAGIIKALLNDFVRTAKQVWSDLSTSLSTTWNSLWNGIKAFFDSIAATIQTAINTWIGTQKTNWTTFTTSLQTTWSTAWTAINTFLSGVWTTLSGSFSSLTTNMQTAWSTSTAALQTNWSTMWSNINSAITAAWDGVLGMKASLEGIITKIQTLFTEKATTFKTIGSGILDQITAGLNEIGTKLSGFATTFLTNISTQFTNLETTANTAGSNVLDYIVAGLKSFGTKLSGAATNFITSISGAFTAKMTDIKTVGGNVISYVIDGLTATKEDFYTMVSNFKGWIEGAIYDKWADLQSIGEYYAAGIVSGVKAAKETIVKAIEGFAASVIDAVKALLGISSPSKVMAHIGVQMGEGLALGIASSAGLVQSAMASLATQSMNFGGLSLQPNYTLMPAGVASITKTTNYNLNVNYPASAPVRNLADEVRFMQMGSAML